MDLRSNVAHHSNYSEISNHLRETATQRYNHKTTNNKATITTKSDDLLHRTQLEYSTSKFDQWKKKQKILYCFQQRSIFSHWIVRFTMLSSHLFYSLPFCLYAKLDWLNKEIVAWTLSHINKEKATEKTLFD